MKANPWSLGYVTPGGMAVLKLHGKTIRTKRCAPHIVVRYDDSVNGMEYFAIKGTTTQGLERARQIARRDPIMDRSGVKYLILERSGDNYIEVA